MEKEVCRTIGYYVTEKKNQKMNWIEFGNVCRKHGYTLKKIDLTCPLDEQGPFFAIIHKMTELIVKASMGDSEGISMLQCVESYIKQHTEMIVFDPLESVRALMDRSHYYRIVQNSDLAQDQVFTPTFVDLTCNDVEENIRRLKEAGVSYPFVCKPSVSHGLDAHQMAVVFNERGVADCRPPCVAQSFINHNAVLYKIYIVGDEFHISERPSLKNFYPSDRETIFFTTSDVSKIDSTSSLTVLDPEDAAVAPTSQPDVQRLQHIVYTLQRELRMMLIGIDVVIEHGSGRYGIIDINIFPGYDGFPHFFETLMNCVLDAASSSLRFQQPKKASELGKERSSLQTDDSLIRDNCYGRIDNVPHPEELTKMNSTQLTSLENGPCDQDDSGFDTGDSSDERKKKWRMDRGKGGQSKKVAAIKGSAGARSAGTVKMCSRFGKDEGLGEV